MDLWIMIQRLMTLDFLGELGTFPSKAREGRTSQNQPVTPK
ncbi:MAG: hypothetical protein PHT16_03160 [Candidatus Pacebacteria bacterium]|nr:hypothetical protein [Candidatus Paceibacterota bacterium]